MGKYKRLALLAFVLGAFALALAKAASWSFGFGFRLPEPVVEQAAAPAPVVKQKRRGRRNEPPQPRVVLGKLEAHLASSRQHISTHAASLVELQDGRVRAFWFSGSREGAPDVTINSAVFDPQADTWWREREVVGRSATQRGLHRSIAKVGNPVVVRAPNGELWLFYVTVSLGGWAGSSITLVTSADEGETWSQPRRLVTSPFINISTLVKGAPFFYADGTLGLPVYHEFITKFSEILRLDQTGKVIDKQRLAAGGQGTLQPVLLAQDAQHALVLNRYSGKDADKRVLAMRSEDGGRHWSAPQKMTLFNPDAALTGLVLEDGRMLAVLNNETQGRESLSLQLSEDGGQTWRELHRLEEMNVVHDVSMSEGACLEVVENLLRSSDPLLRQADEAILAPYVESARSKTVGGGSCHFEFSYPYMIRTRNGDIHLAYTWNRTFIKHVRIDAQWLKHRLQNGSER
ncbi:MAG: sialidase family protein [Pseudomonadota bacterium]